MAICSTKQRSVVVNTVRYELERKKVVFDAFLYGVLRLKLDFKVEGRLGC